MGIDLRFHDVKENGIFHEKRRAEIFLISGAQQGIVKRK
jgi:hypothetical protein